MLLISSKRSFIVSEKSTNAVSRISKTSLATPIRNTSYRDYFLDYTNVISVEKDGI